MAKIPTRLATYRLTRRTLILGSLAAFATACGGADTSAPPQSSGAPQSSSGAQASIAPTAAPKAGGTLIIRQWTGDPPDLDPFLNVTFRAQEFAGFFYSRLLKFDAGPGTQPNSFIPAPDLAESYQISQDGLTYTFKLRANAKWQNKAPLNGRAVTSDDVIYSFERFRKVSPQKGNLDMVKEVKAPDPQTVVFTLNNVFAPFETTIASPMLWIMPKEVIEADGDARKRVIGSGPFIFDRFEKGVQVVAKRNPDYYFQGTPYVDEVALLIVPEEATAVAGVRAKSIDISGLTASDRKAVGTSDPDIKILEYPQNQLYFMYWRLEAPPFNDVRVRQAVSLALDRDEIISVLWEGTGYPNSALPAGLRSFYLDPRSAAMGPNAKYFKRDVEGAKKLLADAGFAGGLKVPLIASLNAYGNTFNQSVELVIKQLKDAGITADLRPQDYSAYISSTFLGKFDPGVMVWGLETPYQEPHDYLYNMYHPKGGRNHGGVNDTKLTEMIEKQATTLDKAARKAQIDDIQRYLGEQQHYVMGVAGNTVIATQPWVKNFFYETDYGRGGEYVPKLFLDGKK
ncbi:MAG: Dipeptide-binding ABC transporter, periplasmic substrate-binding component [uncultured Thermomicrobiales bacterium]|uniref:Dipeptide-binding ABC transporter, periplasmic substrate-binding component n=1 Tax=uncultured Thermomicrobiales bacterium TaxID=1645740 RepID=A0A6J4VMF9_9BACT|nr:MAG: Dipeptide-binding ABC transporter, periplasmic substrate-binding component [uncultured Thermomicrobiales bacterium]